MEISTIEKLAAEYIESSKGMVDHKKYILFVPVPVFSRITRKSRG